MNRQTSTIHRFFDSAGDTVDGFIDGPCDFFDGRVVRYRGQFHFDFDLRHRHFHLGRVGFDLHGRLVFGWMARRWRRWARRSAPRTRTLFPA